MSAAIVCAASSNETRVVGNRLRVSAPRIDGTGMVVMPGLVDTRARCG